MSFQQKISRRIFLFFFAFVLVSPSVALAQQGSVVSDNELAAKAGMEILKAGGNAVDAAVLEIANRLP
jgi:gamma-glutamyltranspeptidase